MPVRCPMQAIHGRQEGGMCLSNDLRHVWRQQGLAADLWQQQQGLRQHLRAATRCVPGDERSDCQVRGKVRYVNKEELN